MLPWLLELPKIRDMRVAADGYTSSAFTMTWDVHPKLSKDAIEAVGACTLKRGGGGDCPEQQPQALRAGVAAQNKDNVSGFEQKSKRAVTAPQIMRLVY